MSLINKMLQDLDARGTPGAEAFPSHVRPVAAPERRAPSLRLAGLCAGGVLAAGALGWFAWERLHAAPVQPAAVLQPAVKRTDTLKPGLAMTGTITQLPATRPAAEGAAAVALPAPAATPAKAADAAPAEPPAAAPAPARSPAREHAPAPAPAREAEPAVAGAEPKSFAPMEPDSPEAREARKAAAIELATRQARLARIARLAETPAPSKAGPGRKGAAPAEGRQESTAQRAENEYGRALASLQDGRMTEALASLQQALRIDPGHDAARQTLVSLLVEANRPEDAMRELETGLARDPRQPAMAMLLARLQIERGGPAIETLARSLPYAGNDPEYHAFLAGALQRQGRQRDAAEQYQQALRTVPGNGVWWMGLGISLQADKRNAEALDAFQKARASGGLNAELQAFVERRIAQLGR